jgi:hypothetical protein
MHARTGGLAAVLQARIATPRPPNPARAAPARRVGAARRGGT